MAKEKRQKEGTLRQEYSNLADRYASAFSLKYFDGSDYYWIGGDSGWMIEIGDYFVSYETIRYSVDNDVDNETLFSWMDYGVTVGTIDSRIPVPTLDYWANGKRGIPKERLDEIEKASSSVRLSEMHLRDLIDETLSANGIETPLF